MYCYEACSKRSNAAVERLRKFENIATSKPACSKNSLLNSPGCRKQCIFKRGVENLPYPMSMTQNRKHSVVKSGGAHFEIFPKDTWHHLRQ